MLKTGITELSQEFQTIVEALELSLRAEASDEATQMLKMIEALKQNIQIMLRLDSDVENRNTPAVSTEEISEIADYALNLLDEISVSCASRGLQQQMLQLHRLSLPVVSWLHFHKGTLKKLDIVVNAIASYANIQQDTAQLEGLCALIKQVVAVTDPVIKSDLEAINPMRPWRILNLNWGIVATRSHNTELMAQVFDQMIKNIPADVQQFFDEGMQQMEIVNYPQGVRALMKRYAQGHGGAAPRH